MRKWILIILAPLILFQYASAQDAEGCTQLLEDAKEAYAAGMVEIVPELLLPCIESGLTGALKQEAYKLVISSYLFDYMPNEADSLMSDFLDENPAYQSAPADPSEFTILLNAQKAQRAEQLEAIREQERIEEAARIEKEKQKPPREKRQKPERTGTDAGAYAGFILGTNLSFPQLVEPYSTSDPMVSGGNYSKATPGIHFGGAITLKLSHSVDASFELVYQRSRLNYNATPYTFTSYEYKEVENRFALPVSFIFNLNPDSRTQVYLRLGIVVDYMLSAQASAVRSYTSAGNPDVVLEQTDITASRSRMNLYGMGGIGLKIPVQRSYIFIESRFQYGLFMSNKESERYGNKDLIWLIYHVDNDFKLHQLNISAGMVFPLK